MKNYRKDFPIFKNYKNLIYLDSAATSQKPQVVIDAIQYYCENYNSNVRRGLYPIAEKATKRVEEVREQVAKFINAKYSEEIIFVRNTTEAINLVAYSLSHNISKEDTIATTIMEHHSNFVPWQSLSLEKGATLKVMDISDNFQLSSENGKWKMENGKLFAITHVSNVLGTVNPIKEIILRVKHKVESRSSKSSRLRSNNINYPLILIDAAQSVPHMKVDVQDLGCDFLALSGHKMFAGTGIGVLYAKKEAQELMKPFLFGGEMIREVTVEKTTFADSPFKFEAGTPDIAGIISLGAAIEYINDTGMENIQRYEEKLMAYSLSQMKKIKGLVILGPKDLKNRLGVISFTLEGIHPHDIAQILGDMGICIRSGHHCAMPLHKRIGLPASARISFSIYNNQDDIDKFLEGLKKVKKMFKI